MAQARGQAPIQAGLQDLADDPGLEERAAQGVVAKLVALSIPRSHAASPLSDEVELRALDDAFARVAGVGLQSMTQEAGLEHGEPATRGGLADCAVALMNPSTRMSASLVA